MKRLDFDEKVDLFNKEEKPESPTLPVDKIVSGNLYAALNHLHLAIANLILITSDLIDQNDHRNHNARMHLESAEKYIYEGKSR